MAGEPWRISSLLRTFRDPASLSHAEHDLAPQALSLLDRMNAEGALPPPLSGKFLFASVLASFRCVSLLLRCKMLHATVLGCDMDVDAVLGAAFVNAYRRCGGSADAERMFFSLRDKDAFLYNLIVTLHGDEGHRTCAIRHYQRMYLEALLPDKVTFISIFCAHSGETEGMNGKHIHCTALSSQFREDVNVCNAILSMYSANGMVNDAKKVFKSMAKVSVVSCNAMMACYVRHRYVDQAFQIFEYMWDQHIEPTKGTFAAVLLCHAEQKHVVRGRRLHSCIIEMGFGGNVAVCNGIIRMYGKCGSLHDAWKVFDGMCERDVISWTAIVTAYAESGRCWAAVKLLNEMQSWVAVDKGAFTTIVSAFITSSSQMNSVADIRPDKHIALSGSKTNEEMDFLILTKRIFYGMETRDVVVWGVMISAYSQTGHVGSALQLFVQMLDENILPDQHVCSRILSVCANDGYLVEGMLLHNLAVEYNIEVDAILGNSLLNLYGKCGSLEDVKQMFYGVPKHDTVAWTVMIEAYSLHGNGEVVLQFYQQMLAEGVLPDKFTFLGVFSACSDYSTLGKGKQLHSHSLAAFFHIDLILGNGLVNMYTKCGDLWIARTCFEIMLERDVSSWNSIISGYAQNGFCDYALYLFWQMKQALVSPNNITFVSVLSACSYNGMLYESFSYLASMHLDHKICPQLEHYNNVIDLLARIGSFDLAECSIRNMPYQPTVISWMIFLSACKYHLDFEGASEAACFVLELDSTNFAPCVVLTSIHVATSKV